jgi:hypothetical protein
MTRASDFVDPADVQDPDAQPAPSDKVDYDGGGSTRRTTAVTLVCIVGVLTLAALLPHARHFNLTGDHPSKPVSILAYPR